MILALPYPPSANRYWRIVRGRAVLSAEARQYKRTVALMAKAQKVSKPFEGPVRLTISVYRPQKSGDLSNRLKVLEDALQGIAFEDDNQVVEIHMRRGDDKANPRAVVTIEQFREEAA